MIEKVKAQHKKLKDKLAEYEYLADVFLMADLKNIEQAQWQIDYYNPKTKKITSFREGEYQAQPKQEAFGETESKIEELNLDKVKIEMKEAIEKCKEDLEKRHDSVNKVIAILQCIDNIPTWNISFMTSNFHLFNRKINAESGETTKESYESLLSFKPQ